MRGSQRTIGVILEAAERVIARNGVEGTTIDDVAREAGVSKGGVLHHFRSKESILSAVLERRLEMFDDEITRREAEELPGAGSFTRAFLRAAVELEPVCVDVVCALISAYRNNPALREIQRDAHTRWQQRVENDGIDPVYASIVRLATDGLWMARMRSVPVPSESIRPAVIDALLDLTRTAGVVTERSTAGSASSH